MRVTLTTKRTPMPPGRGSATGNLATGLALSASGLFLSLACLGQQPAEGLRQTVVPPSPNASALAKYGMVPVSPYTGSANVSIPLYSHEGKQGFTFGIGLDYHTGGIRVDEVASSVGLGWVLSAGGAITRTMVGLPDDINPYGFHYAPAASSVHALKYFRGTEDAEPDVFHYNFNGHAGTFWLAKSSAGGEVQQQAPDGLRIAYAKAGGSPTGAIESFTVTTPQGVRYHFSDRETTQFSNTNLGALPYTSAWMLTHIELPQSGQRITFSYQAFTQAYVASETQTLSIYLSYHGPGVPLDNLSTRQNSINVASKRLLEIDFGNQEKVRFRYHTTRTDIAGDRMLDSVIVGENPLRGFRLNYASAGVRQGLASVHEFAGTSVHPPHSFTYNSGLPARLSKSQDFWGYHNGRPNNYLVPKMEPHEENLFISNRGLIPHAAGYTGDRRPDSGFVKAGSLSRVVYPTGGRTDFHYGSHSTSDHTKVGYSDYRLREAALTGLEPLPYRSFTLENDYPANSLNFDFHFRDYPWGLPNGYNFHFEVRNTAGTVTYASAVFNHSHTNGGTSVVSNNQAMAAGDYRVYWTANYPGTIGEPFFFRLRFRDWVTDSVMLANSTVGGLRIRSVMDYDHTGSRTSARGYSYTKADGTSSSGRLFYRPHHGYQHEHQVFIPDHQGTTIGNLAQYGFYSKSSYPMYSAAYLSGGHIGYERVVERQEGGGQHNGETHYLYHVGSVNYADQMFPFPPFDVRPWRNGSLAEKRVHNSAGILVRREATVYQTTEPAAGLIEGLKIGLRKYDADNEVGHQYATAPYQLWRGYRIPSSIRSVDYHGGDSTVGLTEHQYRAWPSVNHSMPLTTTVAGSDGSREVRHTSYADDYTNTTGFIGGMKTAHLTGYPIEQVSYREVGSTRTILSGTITTYKAGGTGLVDQVLALETAAPVALASFKFSSRALGQLPTSINPAAYSADTRYRLRLSYGDYDTRGNPLQATRADGTSTAYVWGYGMRYPIAEVRNATRSAVVGALGGASAVNAFAGTVAPTDAQVAVFLAPLRTHTGLVRARTDTHTYRPRYGMSSSTDASGRTLWYDYDGFGRLQRIRDHQGNVVEEYRYNYRP